MPRQTTTRCVRTEQVFGPCMVCWQPILGHAHVLDDPLWLRCEAHCPDHKTEAKQPEHELVVA